MNVLLMAHGRGSRYLPDLSKQLINVGGRPIIRRTYDQLSRRGIDDVVVVAPQHFKKTFPADVYVHSFEDEYSEPLLHGIHITSQLWHPKGTYILLGDVLFSNFAIDWLITGNDTKFLGRFTPNILTGKEAPELFALRLAPSDYDAVLRFCRWMTERENPFRSTARLWSLLGMLSAGNVSGHNSSKYNTNYFMAINDYTDDVDSLIEYRNFFGPMLRAALLEDGDASNS